MARLTNWSRILPWWCALLSVSALASAGETAAPFANSSNWASYGKLNADGSGQKTSFQPSSCNVRLVRGNASTQRFSAQRPQVEYFEMRAGRFWIQDHQIRCPESGPNCITRKFRLRSNGPWQSETLNQTTRTTQGDLDIHPSFDIESAEQCTPAPYRNTSAYRWRYRGSGPNPPKVNMSDPALMTVQDGGTTTETTRIGLCRVNYLGNVLIGTVESHYSGKGLVWDGKAFVFASSAPGNQACLVRDPEHSSARPQIWDPNQGKFLQGDAVFFNYQVLMGPSGEGNVQEYDHKKKTATPPANALVVGVHQGKKLYACMRVTGGVTRNPVTHTKYDVTYRTFGALIEGTTACSAMPSWYNYFFDHTGRGKPIEDQEPLYGTSFVREYFLVP